MKKKIITSMAIPVVICLALVFGYIIGHLYCLSEQDNPDAYIEGKLNKGQEIHWKGHDIYPLKGYNKRWNYISAVGAGDDSKKKIWEGK